MKKLKELDNREKLFVAVYQATHDAAKSARKAGYADSTALHKASMWVVPGSKYAKPHVIAALKKKDDKICDKYEVTTEKIVRGFAKLAFADRVSVLDDDHVKDGDRIKCLENLGKHKNIYADSDKNGNDVVHRILVEFKQDTSGTAKGVAVARSRSKYRG